MSDEKFFWTIMKNKFLIVALVLVSLFSIPTLATPRTYLWENAILKYRNLEGLNIKATKNLTLSLTRSDFYRDWPLQYNGTAELWGMDYQPAIAYKVGTWGPYSLAASGGLYVLLRQFGYQEWRPRVTLNAEYLLGPIKLGLSPTYEYRRYQTDDEYVRHRYRIKESVGTTWDFSRIHITPYLTYEQYFQSTRLEDRLLGEATAYQELEFGLNTKLSSKVSFSMAEMFEFNPGYANIRGLYSSHRITTSFVYTVDLVPK